ncbi:MAG: type II toxin-antitoxin system HicB family antitoxin [Nanoarchaeota archaeon]
MKTSFDCAKFEIDIVVQSEGEGKKKIYNARALQIPNIVTQGDSIEEARENLKEALLLYFEECPSEKENVLTVTKQEEPPIISRIFL